MENCLDSYWVVSVPEESKVELHYPMWLNRQGDSLAALSKRLTWLLQERLGHKWGEKRTSSLWVGV